MKKENFFSKNKYILITLAVCFAAAIIVEMGYLKSIWIYDTNDYWNRGEIIKSPALRLTALMASEVIFSPYFSPQPILLEAETAFLC